MTHTSKPLDIRQGSEGTTFPSTPSLSALASPEIPLVWRSCPEHLALFNALVEWFDERERRRLALAWEPLLPAPTAPAPH